MSIRIIADSCCEFPKELKEKYTCENVPLILTVDDKEVVDDESFDQKSFLKLLSSCRGVPRSACPSPETFLKAYNGKGEPKEEEWIFVVTLSSCLSGSFNSASLAKDLYDEEHKDDKIKRRIKVFDSKSASGGEAQAALKAVELYENGCSFDEIAQKCEDYIEHLNTYFVLESLEVFRKNGRLSNTRAFAANMLNLKPVCKGVGGVIEPAAIQRGIKNALKKMVEVSLEGINDTKERILIINHCNCYERACAVLADFIAKAEFKATMILDTAGVSTLYASDGGIIVSF